MANEIFIDTSGFYAMVVKDDDRHKAAQRVLREARRQKRCFVTTNYVLDEAATLLKARSVTHLIARLFDALGRKGVRPHFWERKRGLTPFPPWQGPAPNRPYLDNVVHYNWHWKWHWGNGELGNNGIHALDLCRWGLGVDYPIRVTSGGGKYRHDDDQETPDTHIVTYNFPGNKSIMWEGLSWSPLGSMLNQFGISFHGENGSIVLIDPGYKQYDEKNKEIGASPAGSKGGEVDHIGNFLDCVRAGGGKDAKRPNSDIEEAHKSTLLCHLGNIAHRTNRVLTTSEKNGHIQGDEEAMKLWTREYEKGWEPKV